MNSASIPITNPSSRKRKRDKPHRHQGKSRNDIKNRRSNKTNNRQHSTKKGDSTYKRPQVGTSSTGQQPPASIFAIRTTPQITKIRVPYNGVPPRPGIEEISQDNTTQRHWGQVLPFTRTRTAAHSHQQGNHQADRTANYNPNLNGQPTTQHAEFGATASLSFSHGNNSTTPPASNNDAAEPKLIPCKARGMPEDHNMINAYFTIPNTIKHADELLCSHPACRSAGPRFLYCKFCEVPVAKRNFRQRHSHLEMYPDPRLALAAQEAIVQGNYVDEQQRQEHQGQHHDNNNNNGMQIPEGVARIQPSSSSNSSTSSDLSETASEQQRREWERLLYERPSSEKGDDMTAWLMRVMAASNHTAVSSLSDDELYSIED